MRLFNWFTDKCNRNACTCWFDRFKEWDWSECCERHDNDYTNRNSHNKSKWKIDNELFECVREKTNFIFACIMWIGNKSFSWYAWRMYK